MSLFTPCFPQFPLSEYVECLWRVRGPMPYRREKILPTGTIDLIINFGQPYKRIDSQTGAVLSEQKQSWLCGLQNEFILSEAGSDFTDVIGVRFKPGGMFAFFDFPAAEISNDLIELDLIWGRFARDVREQLLETQILDRQFAIFEAALLQKLRGEFNHLKTIRFAIEHLEQTEHLPSLRALSEKIGFTQKHVITLFNKMVGVSPKRLYRISKFQKVLHAVDPASSASWAEIAYACGYYDQAHFNKDFSGFTGLTPSAYLAQRKKIFGEALQKGQDVHFVPTG